MPIVASPSSHIASRHSIISFFRSASRRNRHLPAISRLGRSNRHLSVSSLVPRRHQGYGHDGAQHPRRRHPEPDARGRHGVWPSGPHMGAARVPPQLPQPPAGTLVGAAALPAEGLGWPSGRGGHDMPRTKGKGGGKPHKAVSPLHPCH